MKVGFDLDNVLNKLNEVWLTEYNKDFGDILTVDNITHWGIDEFVKPEARDDIFNYLDRPDFFLDLPVMDGAKQCLKNLKKFFDLFIITAYRPNMMRDKCLWLHKHFPFISKDNIIFANDKSVIGVDVLVDDKTENILDFPKNKIVFTQPWNKYDSRLFNIQDRSDFHRAEDFREVEKGLKKFIRKDYNS